MEVLRRVEPGLEGLQESVSTLRAQEVMQMVNKMEGAMRGYEGPELKTILAKQIIALLYSSMDSLSVHT